LHFSASTLLATYFQKMFWSCSGAYFAVFWCYLGQQKKYAETATSNGAIWDEVTLAPKYKKAPYLMPD
jgi:hypothetical protein